MKARGRGRDLGWWLLRSGALELLEFSPGVPIGARLLVASKRRWTLPFQHYTSALMSPDEISLSFVSQWARHVKNRVKREQATACPQVKTCATVEIIDWNAQKIRKCVLNTYGTTDSQSFQCLIECDFREEHEVHNAAHIAEAESFTLAGEASWFRFQSYTEFCTLGMLTVTFN